MNCPLCGKSVSYDEIGLNKKLLRRDAADFRCLRCLAEKLDVPAARLEEKIGEYRSSGCLLFAKVP